MDCGKRLVPGIDQRGMTGDVKRGVDRAPAPPPLRID